MVMASVNSTIQIDEVVLIHLINYSNKVSQFFQTKCSLSVEVKHSRAVLTEVRVLALLS